MSNDLISAAAFIRRRVPCLKKLNGGRSTRESLLMSLSWHSALKSLCIVKCGEKIEAVGFARAIQDPIDARFAFKTDERGSLLYVENIASRSTEGMKNLLRYVMFRWPQCDRIMFRRAKSGHKNKTYPMKEFLQKAKVI